MIDREALFREEALEFRARARQTPGSVVRLGAPWLRWSYRLALLLVAVGIALAVVVRTTTTTTGAAVVDGRDGSFSALLPPAAAPQLRSAEAMRIELTREGSPTLAATVTGARAVASSTAVPGLPRPEEPAILLRGLVAPAAHGETALPRERRLRGRATVILRSERVGEVVLRQLRAMFARGGSAA
jgi:hypothetical protein